MGATMELYLIGAYGRIANEKDWNSGKDFKIINGPYCSIRDVPNLKADGYTFLVFLDSMLHQVFLVTI